MGYRVKAACVVAKVNSETGEGYFYRDAILPDGVPPEEAERLEELGLVEKVDDPAPEAEAEKSEGSDGDSSADVGKDASTAQPAKKAATSSKS